MPESSSGVSWHQRRGTVQCVRTMFAAYLVVIVGGVVLYLVVALTVK